MNEETIEASELLQITWKYDLPLHVPIKSDLYQENVEAKKDCQFQVIM